MSANPRAGVIRQSSTAPPGRMVRACLTARGRSAVLWAALWAPVCGAFDLPAPEQLARESGLVPETIAVVEPHESDARHEVVVGYTGFPLVPLLERWFGSRWAAPEAEVLFRARDGYQSPIAAATLRTERAWLAFARSDGAAFTVDNPEQNQTHVPLGPYYVVWDNRARPDRLARGTHGWAYQVTAVDVWTAQDDGALLPPDAPPDIRQGFSDTKQYCLSCHTLRGVGGRKYPVDLAEASCRWDDAGLAAWLGDPAAVRPGTTMPALNRRLPTAERERVIARIVAYLRAVRRSDRNCAAAPSR